MLRNPRPRDWSCTRRKVTSAARVCREGQLRTPATQPRSASRVVRARSGRIGPVAAAAVVGWGRRSLRGPRCRSWRGGVGSCAAWARLLVTTLAATQYVTALLAKFRRDLLLEAFDALLDAFLQALDPTLDFLGEVLEGNLTALGPILLGHHQREHAVIQVRVDVFQIGAVGEDEGASERAVGALERIIRVCLVPSLFLALPAHGQSISGERNVDVVRLDAGQVRRDHQLVRALTSFKGRYERAACALDGFPKVEVRRQLERIS